MDMQIRFADLDEFRGLSAATRQALGTTSEYSLSEVKELIQNGDLAKPQTFTTEELTVTPSTSQQIKTPTANGYSKVTVNAIQTETKNVTVNGDVTPSAGKYLSKVSVNVPIPTFTTEEITVTPTKAQQTRTPTADGYSKVVVNPIPDQYIIPSGSQNIVANGVYDISEKASINVSVPTGGSDKNIQCYHGYTTRNATSYGETSVALTVAKTGTYKVSWMAYRNRNSGTFGTQLYINGSAYGSAVTSWVNTYGQSVVLNNVALTAGRTVAVGARSGNTSYVIGVGNLIIEEV